MPIDARTLREAKDARARLLDLEHELERARADYRHSIRRMCAEGASMREIAASLGMSHQRVHQIIEASEADLKANGGKSPPLLRRVGRRRRKDGSRWIGERLTERAANVLAVAQDEARSLGHGYLGTEHLLLGLLREPDGPAAVALKSLNVTHDAVRAQVVRIIGEGTSTGPARRRRNCDGEASTGSLAFTPRSKRVLEQAHGEAAALGHNYVGTEHLLLALVAVDEGVAARTLADLAADEAAVRAALSRLLAA